MSAPPPTTSEHQPSLEHLLLRFGLVTLDQLSLALREQTEIGTPFTESLVRDGIVSAEDLARVADRAPSVAPQAPAADEHAAPFAPPPVFEGAPPAEPFAPEAPSEEGFAEPPLSESAPEPPYERPTVRFTTHPPAGAYDPAAEERPFERPSEPPVSYEPAVEREPAGFSFDPEPEAAAAEREELSFDPEPPAFEQAPSDFASDSEPAAFEAPSADHAPSDVSFVAEPPAFEAEAPAEEPEPVAVAPVPLPPIFSFDPEPAEAVPAPPAAAAEAPPTFEPPTSVVVPTGFVVRGRLVNGEDVEIATVEDEAEAQRIARDAMRACARADGSDWPILNGRYVRPDAIVSIEVAERV